MKVRIVLVRPRYAGNVGSILRVAANFAADEVVLLAPEYDRDDPDFVRMAMGAGSIVPIREVATLAEAIADADFVVATTSLRDRDGSGVATPSEMVERLAATGPSLLALVFGSERGGLRRDEMIHAHFTVSVPTNPAFPVLNLAQAVAVVLVGVRAQQFELHEPDDAMDRVAGFGAFDEACAHFEEVLLETGFLDPANPRRVGDQWRRWLGRGLPSLREVALLHALASHVTYLSGRSDAVGAGGADSGMGSLATVASRSGSKR